MKKKCEFCKKYFEAIRSNSICPKLKCKKRKHIIQVQAGQKKCKVLKVEFNKYKDKFVKEDKTLLLTITELQRATGVRFVQLFNKIVNDGAVISGI